MHDLVLSIVSQRCQVEEEKEDGQAHHRTHGVGDGGGDSQEILRREDFPGGVSAEGRVCKNKLVCW